MMGGPSLLPGIVTTDRTLLTSVARHNRGIEIQRQPIHSDLGKEPAIEGTEYVIADRLRELAGSRITALKFAMREKPNKRSYTGS